MSPDSSVLENKGGRVAADKVVSRAVVVLAVPLKIRSALVCNPYPSRLIDQAITEARLAPRVASVTKSQYNELSP